MNINTCLLQSEYFHIENCCHFINRKRLIKSSHTLKKELNDTKQTLINNGFSYNIFDENRKKYCK